MKFAAALSAATAILACASAVASDAHLSVRPLTSEAFSVSVAQGDSFTVRIRLEDLTDGAADLSCNANLFRLVITRPGIEVTGYSWTAPWQTGGPTDQSLRGLILPVAVYPETLQGPGYPINTSDVEFGNFLMTGSAQPGEYARVSLRVPQETPVGTEFFLVASADSFTDGFDTLAVATGAVLRVNVVAGSGTPIIGDLDGDTRVSGADLALLLGMWGSPNPAGDLDGDGTVGGPDLGLLLSNWS